MHEQPITSKWKQLPNYMTIEDYPPNQDFINNHVVFVSFDFLYDKVFLLSRIETSTTMKTMFPNIWSCDAQKMQQKTKFL